MKRFNLHEILKNKDTKAQESLHTLLGLQIEIPQSTSGSPLEIENNKESQKTDASPLKENDSICAVIRLIIEFYQSGLNEFPNNHASDCFEEFQISESFEKSLLEFSEFKKAKIDNLKKIFEIFLRWPKKDKPNAGYGLKDLIVAEIEMGFIFCLDMAEILKQNIDLQDSKLDLSENLLWYQLFALASFLVDHAAQ